MDKKLSTYLPNSKAGKPNILSMALETFIFQFMLFESGENCCKTTSVFCKGTKNINITLIY